MSFPSLKQLLNTTKHRGVCLTTLAGLTLLGACSSGKSGSQNVPNGDSEFDDPARTAPCGDLGHEAAVQITKANLKSVSDTMADRSAFLEGTSLFERLLGIELEPSASEAGDASDDDSLSAWLEERVLHPDQLESSDGPSVVYRLKADIFCDKVESVWGLVDDPVPEAEPDPQCADALAENAYRVVVSRVACDSGDNVNIELRVGDRPLIPLKAQLHQDRTAMEANLADWFTLMDLLHVFDEGVVLDEDLRGKLRVVYDVSTAQQATMRIAITEAIALGATTEDGERLGLRMDRSPEALELRIDEGRELLEGALRLESTELILPFNFLISELFDATGTADDSEVASISVAGLGADFNYTPSEDVLHLSDVHLGSASSYIRHGSDSLVRIDVNSSSGRSFDLDVSTSNDDFLQLAFSPEFHLRLEYGLASVEHMTENLPAFTTDDLLQIQLSGATTPTVLLHEDTSGSLNWSNERIGSVLQVLSGELTMTSTRFSGENVAVGVQQCLLRDPSGIYEHGFLGPFESGSCDGSFEALSVPAQRGADLARAQHPSLNLKALHSRLNRMSSSVR